VSRRVVVIGAGGQAREVEWLLAETHDGPHVCVGYVVSDLSRLGETDSVARVLGDFDWLAQNRDAFDAIALGVGTPAAREKLSADLLAMFDESFFPALVHRSTVMDLASCRIGIGAMIAAGAILTINVEVGRFALINFGAMIGHEARIGEAAVVNPGVNLSGGVQIGSAALIGTGAKVLQYRRVGNGAIVGAGAVVTRDVEEGVTVVGVPARARRRN
jgi:sugar O-acyltransferase (sialic acid O-acetyltransferase NeuD family)